MGGTAGTAESPSKRDLHRVTTQEKLFQSEFNAPAGHCSMLNAGEVRWTLRGYLPPKHLRIPGYDYGRPEDSESNLFDEASPRIIGRESTRELMAGVFLPSASDVDMSENASKVTITLDDTRTVKGNMSSRPSWGGAHYAKAAEMAVPNYAM
mmetsp:Transcript_9117/g.25406  ORF Transcript_9117/g.25406 Transcript_9117/m.25406 type:complete len:152 (+) Transcript_9117:201-656(+)